MSSKLDKLLTIWEEGKRHLNTLQNTVGNWSDREYFESSIKEIEEEIAKLKAEENQFVEADEKPPEERITEFCLNFKIQHDRWPTLREVGAELGLKILNLEKLPFVTVIPSKNIKLKGGFNDDENENSES